MKSFGLVIIGLFAALVKKGETNHGGSGFLARVFAILP
jgi:hypothetical protein